jgi:hypothetical protein
MKDLTIGEAARRAGVAVAVAKDGTVFVADFANNRVKKWRARK